MRLAELDCLYPWKITFSLGILSSLSAPPKSELIILTESPTSTSLSTCKPVENLAKRTLSTIILFRRSVFPSPDNRIPVLSCPGPAEKTEFLTVKLEQFDPAANFYTNLTTLDNPILKEHIPHAKAIAIPTNIRERRRTAVPPDVSDRQILHIRLDSAEHILCRSFDSVDDDILLFFA